MAKRKSQHTAVRDGPVLLKKYIRNFERRGSKIIKQYLALQIRVETTKKKEAAFI